MSLSTLSTEGYCVLPVLSPEEVTSTRDRLVLELRRDPYYKDATRAWNEGMVMGGFGGLATPHSYHNPVTRELRLRVHEVGVQLCPPDAVIEQCPDRTMSRAIHQCPGGESWHRDESPNAKPGSAIFGGWINLNDHDEYFACCPGSQRIGTGGNINFQTIPKEERPEWKAREVKVPIPPGHLVVFYENIVHRVYTGKKRREYRLFVGWRIGTNRDDELDPTLHERMVRHQVPKIKGGMQPPVYARQHMASWIERVAEWSKNVQDVHCYNHVVRSGKNAGKTFRIAKRYPMNPDMSYPKYTALELFVLRPHTPEEYALAVQTPAPAPVPAPVPAPKRSAPASLPKKSKKSKCSATFVVLDDNRALQFYSKSKFPDAKYLSNFTEYGTEYAGTSVEKEFCKAKYEYAGASCPDLTGLTGAEVKQLHGKKHLFIDISSWNRAAPAVMKTLIVDRCRADPKFAALLSKYKYFLHQENRARNPIWGGRVKDGALVGENKLGKIFSQVAHALPAPEAPEARAFDRLFSVTETRRTQMLGCTLESILASVPSRVLRDMSDETLEELSYQLRKARWDKKAFCYHVECTREEAIAKGELGGYVAGELGTHYFFFEPKASEFTDDQRQLISDHTACCFMQGQPCGAQARDDDPCTHKMGNDNGSYWFQMNLGPGTFRSECDVDLIEPMFVRTFQSGDFKSGVFTAQDNIYSMEELKECFDLNTMDVDNLVEVAAFLQNPVELSVKESIAGMDGVATYKRK